MPPGDSSSQPFLIGSYGGSMDHRRLGVRGPLVSSVGLGCNNFSRPGTATETLEESVAVIHAALDAGVTFLDGADIYGGAIGRSEEFIGVALAGRRDEVVLATKFGHADFDAYPGLALGPKGGERYIRYAIEQSLRRLRTDHIDLYQLHTPDPQTPIAETLGVLADLVDEGKVRFLGITQCDAELVAAAADWARDTGRPGFVSAQHEYSLLARSAEARLLPEVARRGWGFLPFFPLFNGLLTGKYAADGGGQGRLRSIKTGVLEGVDWARLDAFRALCDEAGLTMLEASIGWLLAQWTVSSVIAGATRPEQVRANAQATTLDADLADRVGALFAQP